MSEMQAFYSQLHSAPGPYWISLAKLTQITLEQMKKFASELIWNIWD